MQALALAQAAGGDRLLGGSILDAMSHQATFAGRYTEAATLAGSAETITEMRPRSDKPPGAKAPTGPAITTNLSSYLTVNQLAGSV